MGEYGITKTLEVENEIIEAVKTINKVRCSFYCGSCPSHIDFDYPFCKSRSIATSQVDPKIVQLASPQYPLVLDDQGNVWGTATKSLYFNHSYFHFPFQLKKVNGLKDIVSVTSSFGGIDLALKNDGTVWRVEQEETQEDRGEKYGITTYSTPTLGDQIPTLKDIVKITSTGYLSAGIDKYDKLWIWKASIDDLLYDRPLQFNPVQITGLDHVKDVSFNVGGTTILKEDGTVWAWDRFPYQVDLADMQSTNPVQIKGLTDITKIDHGDRGSADHFALKKDGTVWTWGHGILAKPISDGSTAGAAPFQVAGLSDVVDISTGRDHMLAVKKDGTVWIWGYFPKKWKFGAPPYSPDNYWPISQLDGFTDILTVIAGDETDMVIKKDGTLWLWGIDGGSLVSDGLFHSKPVQVDFTPN